MESLALDLFDDPAIEEENDVMIAGRAGSSSGSSSSCSGGGSEAEGESETSGGVTAVAVAGADCDNMVAFAGGGVSVN